MKINEELVWVTLANLFFLDNEPDENDFNQAVDLLKAHGWDRLATHEFMVRHIAPQVASNLGHLIYPVSGNWSGFDQADIAEKVRQSIAVRQRRSAWCFYLSDWWYKRMLVKLSFHKLLDRLEEGRS